jgi:hypothetical protein
MATQYLKYSFVIDGVRTSATLEPHLVYLMQSRFGAARLQQLIHQFAQEKPITATRSKHILVRLVELMSKATDKKQLMKLADAELK